MQALFRSRACRRRKQAGLLRTVVAPLEQNRPRTRVSLVPEPHVNRYAWGVFVIVSALAMLTVALTGFRKGEPWAWKAAWYIIGFFIVVAVIEPDHFFPVIFAIIIVATLLYSRPWFNRGSRRT
jgi:lysylphosphatidylglycerol synthetase-like protein (DUF2156 family)